MVVANCAILRWLGACDAPILRCVRSARATPFTGTPLGTVWRALALQTARYATRLYASLAIKDTFLVLEAALPVSLTALLAQSLILIVPCVPSAISCLVPAANRAPHNALTALPILHVLAALKDTFSQPPAAFRAPFNAQTAQPHLRPAPCATLDTIYQEHHVMLAAVPALPAIVPPHVSPVSLATTSTRQPAFPVKSWIHGVSHVILPHAYNVPLVMRSMGPDVLIAVHYCPGARSVTALQAATCA